MRLHLLSPKRYGAAKRREMGNVCLSGMEDRKTGCVQEGVFLDGCYDGGDKHEPRNQQVLVDASNPSNSDFSSHPSCSCEENILDEKNQFGDLKHPTEPASMSKSNNSFRLSPRLLRKALHSRPGDEIEDTKEDVKDKASPSQRSSSFRRMRRRSQESNEIHTRHVSIDNQECQSSDHRTLKSVRQRSSRLTHNLGQVVGHFLQSLEEFFFPRMILDSTTGNPLVMERPRVLGGVLLRDCQTAEEHHLKVQEFLKSIRHLHGQEGLRAVGLEYRVLPCDAHSPVLAESSSCGESGDSVSCEDAPGEVYYLPTFPTSVPKRIVSGQSRDVSDSMRSDISVQSVVDVAVSLPSPDDINEADFATASEAEFASGLARRCHLCMRRLYDVDSDTLVTEAIRKRFIADGDMYEEVARLCQEYAHDIMCQEGNMEWVTIEPQGDQVKGPIRAIINKDHPLIVGNLSNEMTNRPSLLIATGRGKVRAGIFSRQHLMCSGLESATAVPIVREALRRHLNIIVADPNCQGEAQGFVVFEKTMDYLSSLLPSSQHCANETPLQARDLYVLSHSASGGHLARYLLDKSDVFLPHIQAIAFTDSTHNIQWCKTRNNEDLRDMLESPKCVYFRSSKARVEDQSQWYLHRAGEEIATDSFWQHRFGKIQTFWAGTNEHSMTNWFAHGEIWKHFDRHLKTTPAFADQPCKGDSLRPEPAPKAHDVHPHHHFSLREPGSTLVL